MADEAMDTSDNLVEEGDAVQKPPDVKPLPLQFMKKFGKPLAKMSRDDLEEFVMQKICEAMVYKSQLGEERKRLDKLENVMLKYRQRLKDMHKQYSVLQVVHKRAVQDLQKRANKIAIPVKETRNVGLQVGFPQFPLMGHPTTMVQTEEDVKRKSGIAVISPKSNTISPESSTKGTASGAVWNGGQLTTIGQRVPTPVAGGIHPLPNVIRPSVPVNVTYMHNATPTSVTIKPADPSKPTVGIVNGLPGSSFPSSTATSSSGSNNGRPPLSAVQQQEQELMAGQQAEQKLQDIHSQQAQIAKIAACSSSKVDGGNSPTGITPIPPVCMNNGYVQIERKPISTRDAIVSYGDHTTDCYYTKRTVEPTAPQPQPGRASAASNSLIDLTDEEEPRGPFGGGSSFQRCLNL
ncbi:hypothetical protein ZHAS_00012347 [Anopheles sinensis]|uniref:Uncharacterized protein n=1 Tax=Anopheles sinensis TaxID=74873 RepID=A0A084W2F8_ANOSI|nr:hypothetical protein ZHAS_00012347 [Anopheles sinensis]